MRIAHTADQHLGFRAYSRSTPSGVNVREWDVAQAFQHAIQGIAAAKPDLVISAGDLFHSPRPSNHAITFAYRQFRWLGEQLPGVPIILLCGNHEAPKTSETGCILRLLAELPGVRVALQPTDWRLELPAGDVHVRALPETLRPAEVGTPHDATYELLVAHGDVPALAQRWTGEPQPRHMLDPGLLGAWTYVALGHYHVATQAGDRAWYAGSLEFTSTNPWAELSVRKGWLLVDLADRHTTRVDFQPVPTRMFVDLDPVDAIDRTPAEVMAALRANLPPAYEGWVLRQKVLNLSRETGRALDHAAIREWKATALHYHLDLRRPAREVVTTSGNPVRKRPTLAEAVADFFSRRELPPDVDREVLVRTAQGLLDEVNRTEAEQ